MARYPTFLDFTIQDVFRNAWVREPGLRLYVRRSLPIRGTQYDLANVTADKPGSGALTRFLDQWEPNATFYLENVTEARLIAFYERRGYRIVNECSGVVDMAKP